MSPKDRNELEGKEINRPLQILKLHSKMSQNDRNEAYNKISSKETFILLCTDIAARGIDFDIGHVIHFDVPLEPLNFTHRSGRTGRNGRSGDSLMLLMKNELPYLRYLEQKGIKVSEKEGIKVSEQKGIKVSEKEGIKVSEQKEIGEQKDTSEQTVIKLDNSLNKVDDSDNIKSIKADNSINKVYEQDNKQLNKNLNKIDEQNKVNERNLIEINLDSKTRSLGVKAFVAYIRAYKEYQLSFIFRYQELNFDSLVKLFFLEKIPVMDELRNIKFLGFTKPKTKSREEAKKISIKRSKQRKN